MGTASAADMLAFKKAVTKVLTPYASAVLLDPEYGLGAIASRGSGTGVMLAYEKSGYDVTDKNRLPDLLPEWSARRLVEAGANAIKILLYYNPLDKVQVNTIKQAYIERIGAECEALDVPFFLEPLVYDATLGNETGLAFAHKKPLYVTQVMEEFSKPRYGVDILKVELPVNPAFVEGTAAFAGGEAAYSRQEALELFRVYQFHICLARIEPAIWRRKVVAIQDIMKGLSHQSNSISKVCLVFSTKPAFS